MHLPAPSLLPPQGDDEEIAKLTERMKSLLGPFVLRRLKQEVAGQLTEKTHATGAPRVAAGGCNLLIFVMEHSACLMKQLPGLCDALVCWQHEAFQHVLL